MAHIGKNYKLLLRRDLCLGCKNYRSAFPEAFRIGWNLQAGGTGDNPLWSRSGVILRPKDPPESNRPRWESEDLFDNSVSYKVIAEFVDWNFATQETIVVIRWHTGSHYWLQCYPEQFAPGNCGSYRYETFDAGTLEILDPAIFGGTVASGGIALGGARWQYWPE